MDKRTQLNNTLNRIFTINTSYIFQPYINTITTIPEKADLGIVECTLNEMLSLMDVANKAELRGQFEVADKIDETIADGINMLSLYFANLNAEAETK